MRGFSRVATHAQPQQEKIGVVSEYSVLLTGLLVVVGYASAGAALLWLATRKFDEEDSFWSHAFDYDNDEVIRKGLDLHGANDSGPADRNHRT